MARASRGAETRRKNASDAERDAQTHAVAAQGVAGSGGALPFADRIQGAFGRFDVSDVRAHTGSAAREANAAMGSMAYATGQDVAFGGSPDLFTAAHEAAHVIQQRAGVSLRGGVGAPGDRYERHADAVAAEVVAGRKAEALLAQMAGGAGGLSHRVQQRRQVQCDTGTAEVAPAEASEPAAEAPGEPGETPAAEGEATAASAEGDTAGSDAVQAHHTVVRGETLGSVSQAYYGTPRHYRAIVTANHIPDPNRVEVGADLLIPVLGREAEVAAAGAEAQPSAAAGESAAPAAAEASDPLWAVLEQAGDAATGVMDAAWDAVGDLASAASDLSDYLFGTGGETEVVPTTVVEELVNVEEAGAAAAGEVQAIIAPFATYVPFTMTIASLDEAGLAAELARAHATSDPTTTRGVFEALDSSDRDDVALALASALTDAQIAALDAGLRAYLAEQLSGGYEAGEESAQAARLTGAGATSDAAPPGGDAEGAAPAAPTAATPELGETTEGGASLGGQTSAEARVGTTLTVLDADARRRDPANLRQQLGTEVLPQGLRVVVVKALGTYVQVVSAPGEATVLTEGDNAWTSAGNLGGTGADVGLGNERTDEAAATTADGIRAELPTGRNPGQSPYTWRFGSGFATSLNGITLNPTLLQKVTRMLEWAVQNDMLAGDVTLGDGMRSPAAAHKLCVSWEIQFGHRVSLDALRALPGGVDADGNHWYTEGWSDAEIKANANRVAARTAGATASEGYPREDARRRPVDSTRDVSRHCSGGAIDVTIPWRARGQDAATNASDVWGWDDIYAQFGIYRAVRSECWHVQETSMTLEQDREPEAGPGAGA